jgi:hypothetical protein
VSYGERIWHRDYQLGFLPLHEPRNSLEEKSRIGQMFQDFPRHNDISGLLDSKFVQFLDVPSDQIFESPFPKKRKPLFAEVNAINTPGGFG